MSAGLFLLRPLPLTYKWPSSPVPSRGLFSVCVCVLISFYKDTGHTGLGPTRLNLFYPHQPL